MPSTHITINSYNGESSTQTIGTPTTERSSVDYTQKAPGNLSQIFVSKVFRTLSLDSSIPVMPSMNTSTMVPVHEVNTSSSEMSDEKSLSRSSSGARSDLYFPGDLGHKGNEDKLPLHGGLKDPIWVTPKICPHNQTTNGEMCSICKKNAGNRLEKPERTPDFTVLNLYGPRKAAKKCKCGIISTLAICFSVFVSVFILALVIYCEFIKQKSPAIVHYKM